MSVAPGKPYETAGRYARAARAGDPSDPGIRRDLAIARTKIGNSRVANGDLSGALEIMTARPALLEEITRTAAPNPEWLSDLAVTNDDIGGVLLTQGDCPAHPAAFKSSFEIKQRSRQCGAPTPDGSAT